MSLDMDHLKSWIGREQHMEDVAAPGPVARLMATLDRDDPPPLPGDPVPPPAHWLYFLASGRGSQLEADGHDARGGFLPPVPFPRRMWAGGRVQFLTPLRIGEALRRVSRITDVSLKQGRTGPLIFVTVRHEITGGDRLAIREDQTIVYRETQSVTIPPVTADGASGDAPWRREVVPHAVMLFRYSALTFNAHRIHYDLPYATETEGYPGLVVQGPLIATLLLDLCRRQGRDVAVFDYRARLPLFAGEAALLTGVPGDGGKRAALRAMNVDGAVGMTADVEFRA